MSALDPSPVVCIGPAIAWHGETGACPHAAVLAWDGATARRRSSKLKRCADCKRERKRRLMAYSRVGWDRAQAGTFFCPGPETPDDPHYWCGMEIDFRTRLTRCNACQERRLLWKAEYGSIAEAHAYARAVVALRLEQTVIYDAMRRRRERAASRDGFVLL